MRRRGKASGNTIKTQRRQTLKRRNAPKVAARRKPSPSDPYEKIALLEHRLDEALEQQAAMSEILGVISNSPTDLAPVFNAILANATRLCEGNLAALWRYDGKFLIGAAQHNASAAFADKYMGTKMEPGRAGPARLAALERRTVHVADITAEPGFSPLVLQYERARSVLAVPLLRRMDLVGVIAIWRREVRPFTDKQVELLTNFAAQAVIAIENTRLLNELRESLQQQTATADVLKVISSSPGDLDSVFNAMLEKATHICEAKFGTLYLREGDGLRTVATHNAPTRYVEDRKRNLVRPPPDSALGQVLKTHRVTQVADITAVKSYVEGDPYLVSAVKLGGYRTIAAVPMLKDDSLIGAITINRQEVQLFTDKQIELLQNFASQAVIAIENTRLLNELRQRTDDLSESLEQQTATSEVLKVISASPGELEPVFQAMLQNATRICDAQFGILWRYDGELFYPGAKHGVPPAFSEFIEQRGPTPGVKGSPLERVLVAKKPVHTADELSEPIPGAPAKYGGARSLVAVPMLKDDELVGAFVIYRQEVRPFSDKQVELLKNFAAQAVIAIENTRLLNELRESLQQQTATADVLKVIAGSSGELAPAFKAMLDNAVRICEASYGAMWLFDGNKFRNAAFYGALSPAYTERWRSGMPFDPGPHSPLTRVSQSRKPLQVEDLQEDPAYRDDHPLAVASVDIAGIRTLICVPMLKDEELVGVIVVYRKEVRPFTDKQIGLLTNFAAQAVIAIENARLLNELRERTHELAASLDNLRTTQDRLVQTQKLASLGQLTAGIAHEIKNPLNFVNNFSGVSAELVDELREALKEASFNEARRDEITELMDTLRGNLEKVVQHGKRADAIVKNMLLHSREGTGEHRLIDINVLVEEGLNLAYHGARAEKQGFNIKLERSFDPNAGEADVFPQDITRVLLNLISNGFYAATKRSAATNGGDYEPTLAAATKNRGDRVEITVRDNGTGIPADVKEKMFNPFFTTKPAGEGTGLGLSISHDIIVKQHGGSIEVETQPGEFTEIRIILPRAGAFPQ